MVVSLMVRRPDVFRARRVFRRIYPAGACNCENGVDKDPREEKGMMAQFLWALEPFDDIKMRHEHQMKKYKNTPPRTAAVFTGLSNYTPTKD